MHFHLTIFIVMVVLTFLIFAVSFIVPFFKSLSLPFFEILAILFLLILHFTFPLIPVFSLYTSRFYYILFFLSYYFECFFFGLTTSFCSFAVVFDAVVSDRLLLICTLLFFEFSFCNSFFSFTSIPFSINAKPYVTP